MFAQVKHDLDLSPDVYRNYLQAAGKELADNMDYCAGWFLVSTPGRKEHCVESRMVEAGVDVWLPMTTETVIVEERRGYKRKGRKRRKKPIGEEVMVFPGHLLCRFVPSAQAWHGIMGIRDVMGIYCDWRSFMADDFNRRLESSMSTRVINRLRELSTEQHGARETVFKPGEAVTLTDGPFAGQQGTVGHKSTPYGLVAVEVTMFGRLTPMLLDIEQIEHV